MREKGCGMESSAAMLVRAVSHQNAIRDPSAVRLRVSALREDWERGKVLWKCQLCVSCGEVSLLPIVSGIYCLLLAL